MKRNIFYWFISDLCLYFSSTETENQSPGTVPRHPTDRPGREPDLPGPHHVHAPLRRQVGPPPSSMNINRGGREGSICSRTIKCITSYAPVDFVSTWMKRQRTDAFTSLTRSKTSQFCSHCLINTQPQENYKTPTPREFIFIEKLQRNP